MAIFRSYNFHYPNCADINTDMDNHRGATGTGTGTFSRLYFTNTNTIYIFQRIQSYWIVEFSPVDLDKNHIIVEKIKLLILMNEMLDFALHMELDMDPNSLRCMFIFTGYNLIELSNFRHLKINFKIRIII